MAKQARRPLQYLFMVLAILTGFTGIYILGIWNRALTPDIYKEAFSKSGLYHELTNVIEAQFTYYLQTRGKEIVAAVVREEESEDSFIDRGLIVWVLNTIIDNRTANVVSAMSERIALEENIQVFTESALTNSIGWVRGDVEAPQVLVSIPTVEAAQNLNENGLVRDSLTGIAFNALGFNELPECSNNVDEREVLIQIARGDWLNINCVTARITPALRERIETTIPSDSLANLDVQIREKFDLYRLDTLFQGATDLILDLSKLKEQVVEYRDVIQTVRTFAIGLIIFSVILSAMAYLVSPERTIKTFLYIGLFTGVLLGGIGSILSGTVAKRVSGLIDINELAINSDAISIAQATLLNKSVEMSIIYIGQHLHDYVIQLGIALIIVFGIALLGVTVLERGGKQKIVEWYENFEARIKANLARQTNKR